MARPRRCVLGNLSIDRFLKKYWQKEPLVVRGAFPNLQDPLTADELAGLSCEAHVSSRLVIRRGGTKPWQVIPGPQRTKTLQRLPRSHWTLLVESMDRHSEEIAAFASAFSFLPKWRMDDVMVSLAPVHGTVAAHIDSYDVFLIQGQGLRRWEVDREAKPEYRPGLDLRILRQFRVQDSFVLEPGDMLYVPPGVAHRGVTVRSDAEIALTYSVGFRAPSVVDLLSSLLARAIRNKASPLFSDRGRSSVRDAGEFSGSDVMDLKRFMVDELDNLGPEEWTLAAGEAVTSGGSIAPPARPASLRSIVRSLRAGSIVSPVPSARVTWSGLQQGRAAFFVNGESRVLPRSQAFAAAALCGKGSVRSSRRLAENEDLASLVWSLHRAGVVALRE